jgi:hypothetical protein
MRLSGLVVFALSTRLAFGGGGDRSGRITGNVEGPAELPVANARVLLLSTEKVLEAHSAPDGSFAFEQVPPGSYRLVVKAEGLAKITTALTMPADGTEQHVSAHVTVGPVPDLDTCGASLAVDYLTQSPASSHVQGTVLTIDRNTPIAHAEIQLRSESDPQRVTVLKTDQQGSFVIASFVSGLYTVHIGAKNFRPVELEHVLIPRESSIVITSTLLKRNEMVVCQ